MNETQMSVSTATVLSCAWFLATSALQEPSCIAAVETGCLHSLNSYPLALCRRSFSTLGLEKDNVLQCPQSIPSIPAGHSAYMIRRASPALWGAACFPQGSSLHSHCCALVKPHFERLFLCGRCGYLARSARRNPGLSVRVCSVT